MIWIIINIILGALGLIFLTVPKFNKLLKYIILGIILTIFGNISAYVKSESDSKKDSREFTNYKKNQETKYDSLIQLSNNISFISREILANSQSPELRNKLDSLLEKHEITTKPVTKIKILDVRTFIYEDSESINDFPMTKNGVFLLISILNKNTPTTINSIKIQGSIFLTSLDLEHIYSHYPDDSVAKNKLWNIYPPFINIDFTAYPEKRTRKYVEANEKALLLYVVIEPSFDGYPSIIPEQIGFKGFIKPSSTRTKIYSKLIFKYPLNKQSTYYKNYPFDVRYRDEFFNNNANFYLETDNGLIKIDTKALLFFDRLSKNELENDSFEKMINYWNK